MNSGSHRWIPDAVRGKAARAAGMAWMPMTSSDEQRTRTTLRKPRRGIGQPPRRLNSAPTGTQGTGWLNKSRGGLFDRRAAPTSAPVEEEGPEDLAAPGLEH